MRPELEKVTFEALGTSCQLLAVGLGRDRLEQEADWIREMHQRLSRFLADSELSFFNAGAGGWVEVSSDLESLLREALSAFELSAGLVHVGVLRSMRAIGYTRPLADGPTSVALLEAVPPPPLPEMLGVAPGRAWLAAGYGVDLGGIAKGWLADRLVERMGTNSLANLGGDLRATGGGPEGDGWPVGIGGVTVLLRDQGAATSGTWKRRWTDAGSEELLHHLIDPRTGRPSNSGLFEVSVVAGDGTLAEICAKTALLLGVDEAPAFLAAHAEAWWLC